MPAAARQSWNALSGRSWLHGGCGGSWLSMPVFRRISFCRCCPVMNLSPALHDCKLTLPFRLVSARRILATCNVRSGSLAALLDHISPKSAVERKADMRIAEYSNFWWPLSAMNSHSLEPVTDSSVSRRQNITPNPAIQMRSSELAGILIDIANPEKPV